MRRVNRFADQRICRARKTARISDFEDIFYGLADFER